MAEERPNHNPNEDDPNYADKLCAQYLSFIFSDENAYVADEEEDGPSAPNALPANETPVDPSTNPTFRELHSTICNRQKKNMTKKEFKPCECEKVEGKQHCADDTCTLRKERVECSEDCGPDCQNQRIQKHDFMECLHLGSQRTYFDCLFTSAVIPKNTMIIEYVGKVKCGTLDLNQPFAYPILKYRGNRDKYLDCDKLGNESRYLKHSGAPYCEIQEWVVNGHVRLVVVALEDIPAEAVLTIDYPQRDQHCEKNKYKSKPTHPDAQAGVELEIRKKYDTRETKVGGPCPDLRNPASDTEESEEFPCGYGYCKKVYNTKEDREAHRQRRHLAELDIPDCSVDADDIFKRRPAHQMETLEYYRALKHEEGRHNVDVRARLCDAEHANSEEAAEREHELRRVTALKQRRQEAVEREAERQQIERERLQLREPAPSRGVPVQGRLTMGQRRAIQERQQAEASTKKTAAQKRAVGKRIQEQIKPTRVPSPLDSD